MKKISSIKKNDRHLKIPIPVPRIIEEKITMEFQVARQREKALTVIQHIIHRHQMNYAPMLHHLSYDKKLKLRLLGSDDYSIWGKLVKMEILEEYEFAGGRKYSVTRKQCKRYRINPKHLGTDVIHIDFEINRSQYPTGATEETKDLLDILNKLKQFTTTNAN